MFYNKDEYLHEFKRSSDWIESFNISIIDKKKNLYGFMDIDYLFKKKKVEFNWTVILNNQIYEYSNLADFNGKLDDKTITDKKFEYTIAKPSDLVKLALKDEKINAKLKLSGVFPVYVFPTHFPVEGDGDSDVEVEDKLWNRYAQRCKISGNISVKNKSAKGQKVKVDCFGQREHQWGEKTMEKIISHSRLSIQFRDMLMNLTHVDMDGSQISTGVVSRRSGNIPIQNVECEAVAFDEKNNELTSSEFSFMDAQEEIDLIVSKKIHSIAMPLPRNKRRKFIRFRNFSDFTIVGTNKKGVGIEEHYISRKKLELLSSSSIK